MNSSQLALSRSEVRILHADTDDVFVVSRAAWRLAARSRVAADDDEGVHMCFGISRDRAAFHDHADVGGVLSRLAHMRNLISSESRLVHGIALNSFVAVPSRKGFLDHDVPLSSRRSSNLFDGRTAHILGIAHTQRTFSKSQKAMWSSRVDLPCAPSSV